MLLPSGQSRPRTKPEAIVLNARLVHASVRGLRSPRTQHRRPYPALAYDLRQRPIHGVNPPGARLFLVWVRWGPRIPLAPRTQPRTAFAPDLAATGQWTVALAPSPHRRRGAGCSPHHPEPRRRAPSTRSLRRPSTGHTRYGRASRGFRRSHGLERDEAPRSTWPATRTTGRAGAGPHHTGQHSSRPTPLSYSTRNHPPARPLPRQVNSPAGPSKVASPAG